jgi:conjugative transfer region protein TrbK
VDLKMVLRLGSAGLSGVALFGAAIIQHDGNAPEAIRVFPAIVPADPLAAELTRCRKLGSEAVGNPSCEEAFAESGLSLFSLPNSATER